MKSKGKGTKDCSGAPKGAKVPKSVGTKMKYPKGAKKMR